MCEYYENNGDISEEVFRQVLAERLGEDAVLEEVRRCDKGNIVGFWYKAKRGLSKEMVEEMENRSRDRQLELKIEEAMNDEYAPHSQMLHYMVDQTKLFLQVFGTKPPSRYRFRRQYQCTALL